MIFVSVVIGDDVVVDALSSAGTVVSLAAMSVVVNVIAGLVDV